MSEAQKRKTEEIRHEMQISLFGENMLIVRQTFSSFCMSRQPIHYNPLHHNHLRITLSRAKYRNIQLVSSVPEKQNSKSFLTSVQQKLHTSTELYERTGFN